MIFLLTAPPGVGKSQFAVNEIVKQDELNEKNLKITQQNFSYFLEHLEENKNKMITVDLVEFKGSQNMFKAIRDALDGYDQKEITLEKFFKLFDHCDFEQLFSPTIFPEHFYKSTTLNLLVNFVNKTIQTQFKNFPPVRQIYADINGLRLENVLLSPDDWRTCPDGSIIFYDEVQNRPIYKNTREKNPIIEELTVHRHRGFDIWFITQFPVLIHTEVRAVVGQHYHLYRPWGLPQAYVNVWSYAVIDPNSGAKKRVAERTFKFTYSKKVQKLYTSATMHTHKINIPKKVFLLCAVGLGGLWLAYDGFSGGTLINKKEQTSKIDAAKDAPILNINGTPKEGEKTQEITPEIAQKVKTCVDQFGWSYDACREAYDPTFKVNSDNRPGEVFIYDPSKPYQTLHENVSYEVKVKPVFSGCVKYGNKYTAYTQQGTLLEVDASTCKKLIDNGDRPFNYFAEKQEMKPLEQTPDDHYKKAYLENIARLDAERYVKAKDAVVKPEQIPLGTPVPRDISGANSL